MLVEVESKRTQKQLKIQRMSKYDIETSMDIPADRFNITVENPVDSEGYGMNSELLNPNDTFSIIENETVILDGIADDVEEYWSGYASNIEIDGRDKSLLLLENDAEPKTYYKLKFSGLLEKLSGPYGFTNFKVNPTLDKIIGKIVVEAGDSEWDVLFAEAQKLGMWLWCMPDSTIVADVLNYKEDPSYKFSNDLSINAIRMKTFRKRKSGADIKNEVWVRGHEKKNIGFKYKDKELTYAGAYNRRWKL